MIIIHPLKIAFEDAPKVGSTSLFSWIYGLLYGKEFEPIKRGENVQHLHAWMHQQKNEIIENQTLENFKCPEGYLVFCLVRDPVQRLLSAYKNRVLFHNELNFIDKKGLKNDLIFGELAARPTLNYFVDHLEEYQKIVPSIFHHTRPLVYFLGKDSSIYDYIFELSEMKRLRQVLIDHWLNNKIFENQEIPEIPNLQRGGGKISLGTLSESSFKKSLMYYFDDYLSFSNLKIKETIQFWNKSHSETAMVKPKFVSKAIVSAGLCGEVESLWTSKNQLWVRDGEVESFTGSIVLKTDVIDGDRLIVSDACGEWLLKSLISSDESHQTQHSHDQNTQVIKFEVQGLHANPADEIKVFLENPSGKRWHIFNLINE